MLRIINLITRANKVRKDEGIVKTIQYGISSVIKYFAHPNKYSSEKYIEYLREKGVKIGNGTKFYHAKTCHVDVTRPSLITIGSNVKITRGTQILTHDYAGVVFFHKYNQHIGSAGEVKINDNVYIGNNTTILKDVEIGENVIIGANSLVNKDIPSNTVAGGVPAKKIMSLDQYYQNRKDNYIEEAKLYAESIEKRFNRMPRENDFSEFSPIFSNEESSEPLYDSFEEFLIDCDIGYDQDT